MTVRPAWPDRSCRRNWEDAAARGVARSTPLGRDGARRDPAAVERVLRRNPGAPELRGGREREDKSVMGCLKTVMCGRTWSDEVLRNALSEVEWVVNSRPLTYVATDPGTEEVLTPTISCTAVSVPPTTEEW